MTVEAMRPEDWPAVRSVLEEGIATRNATFETAAPDWEEWDAAHSSLRLVAREEGEVLGWAALAPVASRPAYRGVAEVSVYVAERARGRGVGRALLDELVRRSEQDGVWTLQAGIFPENVPSLLLHARSGFRVVGIRRELGSLDGTWRDVTLLERRSSTVY
jgi:L-amino acid N-acyltransferase YncA